MKKDGQCAKCGGNLEAKRMAIDRRWKGELFVFEDVPVEWCPQCGEVWVSAKVAKKMEACLVQGTGPRRTITVASFSLARMRAA
jgi:YgiT-type zinc finger domain-containing protein